MNPLFRIDFSISDSLKIVRKSVLIYETIIWKDEYYSKNSSTITVHVRHLREKLQDTTEKPQYIKTIWGVGYKI